MNEYALRDQAAIVGVGMTDFTSDSGVSELALSVEAAKAACEDAGVDPKEVDGFASFDSYGEGVSPVILAGFLGYPEPAEILMGAPFGGNMTGMIFGFASMAIASGTASYVLLYRAFNGRSGYRMGGTGTATERAAADRQYTLPFGLHGAPANFAFNAREYVDRYNIDTEDVGHVAISFREHAQLNPHARTYGRPMTMEDYLNSRPIVDPFKQLDCCFEVDGAVALLVTSPDRARDLRHPPVLIRGAAYGYRGMAPGNPRQQPGWHGGGHYTAPRMFRNTGISVEDIDVAFLCDDYTYSFLPQLEEFGWCGSGEAPAFCREGNVKLGGRIPCNTNGGQLSEGFMHGLNNAAEAVTQLRGQAGERQVPNAEVAIVTGTNGASAAVLRRA